MKTHLLWFIALLALTACRGGAYDKLPSVTLIQDDSVRYDKSWHKARFVVDTDTLPAYVRGRGHSTFAQSKHPYAIKFDTPQSMGNASAHKHWVLLANFFDHSLMRNALAMQVAAQTSLACCTPHGTFVTLSTNGKWQGVYWLSERVKDMAGTDSLLKMDVYNWAQQRAAGLPLDTMPSSAVIDTLSFVDWWLVHELCMNAEPNGPRSCYVRLSTEGGAKAGPVWDFDMAFNEVGVDNGGDIRPVKFKGLDNLPPFLKGKRIKWLSVDSMYDAQSALLANLTSDPNFMRLARKRWKELKPYFAHLTKYIKRCRKQLMRYGTADQELWNAQEPARFDSATTWNQAVDKLLHTYKLRIKAMDRLLE